MLLRVIHIATISPTAQIKGIRCDFQQIKMAHMAAAQSIQRVLLTMGRRVHQEPTLRLRSLLVPRHYILIVASIVAWVIR